MGPGIHRTHQRPSVLIILRFLGHLDQLEGLRWSQCPTDALLDVLDHLQQIIVAGEIQIQSTTRSWSQGSRRFLTVPQGFDVGIRIVRVGLIIGIILGERIVIVHEGSQTGESLEPRIVIRYRILMGALGIHQLAGLFHALLVQLQQHLIFRLAVVLGGGVVQQRHHLHTGLVQLFVEEPDEQIAPRPLQHVHDHHRGLTRSQHGGAEGPDAGDVFDHAIRIGSIPLGAKAFAGHEPGLVDDIGQKLLNVGHAITSSLFLQRLIRICSFPDSSLKVFGVDFPISEPSGTCTESFR